MSGPRGNKNMPPSAILGPCHHFRNFIIKTIYSGNYLVFPMTIIRSTSKWYYYILLKWFVELRTYPYTSLNCKLVERVLLWYSPHIPRSVVLSHLVEPMVKASCYRGLQSLFSYRRGVQEMMVEVKCTLTGSEIPPYSYCLFRFQSTIAAWWITNTTIGKKS